MTVFAKHRAADLWLKRHRVVLAAMVANDLKSRRSILAERGFFRAALRAPLRRHHVTLVINFLIFFAEK